MRRIHMLRLSRFSSLGPALVGAVALALLTSGVGCSDPYLDNLIEELGEEQDGYAPSEIHRPGQPCVLCHSGYEGAEPEFSFGGTLFAEPALGEAVPASELILLEGFTVRLLDSEGRIKNLETNRCGNFFIKKDEFDPAYPVRAELWGPPSPGSSDTVQLRPMATRIGRDGSCGTCHIHPASPFSPGVAFVPQAYLEIGLEPPTGCPTPSFSDPL
jgi:hypothetical protein